ncbi:hypothetical protein GCM10008940_02300 [Microbulbifer agarilyticus]
MTKLPLAFATLTLFSATTAVSEDYKVKICSIQSHTSGATAFIKPCESWASKNGCNNGWITWSTTQNNGPAMYSTALTAFTTDSTVTVRLDGTSCLSSYDTTNMIRISK